MWIYSFVSCVQKVTVQKWYIYIYRCTDNFPIIIPITISMYGGFQTVPRFIAGGYMHGSWAQQIVYGKRRVAVLWPVTDFRTRINFLCLFWIAKSSFSTPAITAIPFLGCLSHLDSLRHHFSTSFSLQVCFEIYQPNLKSELKSQSWLANHHFHDFTKHLIFGCHLIESSAIHAFESGAPAVSKVGLQLITSYNRI